MKERPILFSGEMVRAILDGRKTQTRRVVNPQPDGPLFCRVLDGTWGYDLKSQDWKNPFGNPGDRLWVRETWQAWRVCSMEYDEWDVCDCAPSEIYERFGPPKLEYAATSESVGPWKPSIHMPRWASRITLEITAVRVERLQDISENDALEEGSVQWWITSERKPVGGLARNCFRHLWESCYGPESWNANPWVWVIEFRRVMP